MDVGFYRTIHSVRSVFVVLYDFVTLFTVFY